MKKLLLLLLAVCFVSTVHAEENVVWSILNEDGVQLTQICYEPEIGDKYIAADNNQYEVIRVEENAAIVRAEGQVKLPSVEWLDADAALPVAVNVRRIALYCTHSDECYEPSDGYYSTTQRGTIYQVAQALADALMDSGIEASVADMLHHPHDAGAYRRSRQTAVALLKEGIPDALIDVHRDGIPDPNSYAVTIGGEKASKIRLLVGRGNQNAAVNKEFALTIKAVADRVYPGLIKDIYMGKGAFNQDLLPHSILLECGTYTLEKERVLVSMPMIADVLDRTLYGGIIGSAGSRMSDVRSVPENTGGITDGAPDPTPENENGVGSGLGFLAFLLVGGIVGLAILGTGSIRGGMRKTGRHISEMTGGLVGKKPDKGEDPEHS